MTRVAGYTSTVSGRLCDDVYRAMIASKHRLLAHEQLTEADKTALLMCWWAQARYRHLTALDFASWRREQPDDFEAIRRRHAREAQNAVEAGLRRDLAGEAVQR